MIGVILAGGNGTRLRPLTNIVNKHLLPVYDRPMIEYPIKTLVDTGCTEIVIVSGGEHIGGFAEYLGNGSRYGVRLTYRVQAEADGVAGALACVEGLTDGLFPVILGDNYYAETPHVGDGPAIYLSKVDDPERFGVYQDGTVVEKPEQPTSNDAVTGFYVYDDRVFDYIKDLKPSERGELEITDVNNWYLTNGGTVIHHPGFWRDMGTLHTLLEVANKVSHE